MKPVVVSIDGPAGSGKSTVSREVARRLGVEMLDTGAMYRAATLAVLESGVALDDDEAVAEVARRMSLDLGERIMVNGADATEAIRGPAVTAAVSRVSANPQVRHVLVERQRDWVAQHGGGVVEGRDIGTVVLPDAPVKVFLTASAEVRALRRHADEEQARRSTDVAAVQADIERRDRLDSTRAVSPLQPAEDAVTIDTSELSIDAVVERILECVDAARARR